MIFYIDLFFLSFTICMFCYHVHACASRVHMLVCTYVCTCVCLARFSNWNVNKSTKSWCSFYFLLLLLQNTEISLAWATQQCVSLKLPRFLKGVFHSQCLFLIVVETLFFLLLFEVYNSSLLIYDRTFEFKSWVFSIISWIRSILCYKSYTDTKLISYMTQKKEISSITFRENTGGFTVVLLAGI